MDENQEKEQLSEEEKCRRERDEYLEGWKRAKADLINYKKEEIKRFETVMRYSQEGLIRDLIIILDSFELAMRSVYGKGEGGDAGLVVIKAQLENILKKNGLTEVKVERGQLFNPALHEAIVSEEVEGTASGTILEIIEKGYYVNDKLIRPARVKVAK